eukprot:s5435_g4.t1
MSLKGSWADFHVFEIAPYERLFGSCQEKQARYFRQCLLHVLVNDARPVGSRLLSTTCSPNAARPLPREPGPFAECFILSEAALASIVQFPKTGESADGQFASPYPSTPSFAASILVYSLVCSLLWVTQHFVHQQNHILFSKM